MSALLGLFLLMQVLGDPITPKPPVVPAPPPPPSAGSTTPSVAAPDPAATAKSAGESAPFSEMGAAIPIVKGLGDLVNSMINLEPWTQTPKDMTTGNPDIKRIHNLLVQVDIAALAVIIVWVGLVSIGGSAFGDPALLMAVMPRVVAYMLLAIWSLPLLDKSIDVANAVTGSIGKLDMGSYFTTNGPNVPWILTLPPFGTPLSLAGPVVGLLAGIVYLLAAVGTLGFLWMRDVLIGILVAVAPLFIALMAVPKLEHLGHRWAHLYFGLLIANIPVVVALTIGKAAIDLSHGASSLLQIAERIGALLLIPVLMGLFGMVPGVPGLLGLAFAIRIARGAVKGAAGGGPAGAAAGAAAAGGMAAAASATQAVSPAQGAATWKSQNWTPAPVAPSARARPSGATP